MTTTYITPLRESFVGGRVTAMDRALVKAAAAARGTTLSRFVAEAATQAARRELLKAAKTRPEQDRR